MDCVRRVTVWLSASVMGVSNASVHIPSSGTRMRRVKRKPLARNRGRLSLCQVQERGEKSLSSQLQCLGYHKIGEPEAASLKLINQGLYGRYQAAFLRPKQHAKCTGQL